MKKTIRTTTSRILLTGALALTGGLSQIRASSELQTNLFSYSTGPSYTYYISQNPGFPINYNQGARVTTDPLFTVHDDTSQEGFPLTSGSATAGFGYLHFACDSSQIYQNNPLLPDTSTPADTYGSASWTDTVTIDSSLLNGTVGYLRGNVRLSGEMSATTSFNGPGAWSTYTLTLEAHSGVGGYVKYVTDTVYAPEPLGGTRSLPIDLDAVALGGFNSQPNLDIAFIYGEPFTFSANLATVLNYGFNDTANEQADVQFQWLGGTVLDANSAPVSAGSYVMHSDSGTNWTQPGVVPEPSTWAILLGGVGMLAGCKRFGRRSRA